MKVESNTPSKKVVSYSVDELKIIKRNREEHLHKDFLTQDCPQSSSIGRCVAALMEEIPADYNTPDGRLIMSRIVKFLLEPAEQEKFIKDYDDKNGSESTPIPTQA